MKTAVALLVHVLLIQSICVQIRFMASLNAYQNLFERVAKRPTVISNIPATDCTLRNQLVVFNQEDLKKLGQPTALTEVAFDRNENICNKMLDTLEKHNESLLGLNSDLFNRLINRLGINTHYQVKENAFSVGLYSCPERATSQLIAFYSGGQQIPTNWCLKTNSGQECSSIKKDDIRSMNCAPA
uniref:Secreted salivary protein n=1 Tax=Culicoides nubeculosus TaxID=144565 RepID=B9URJ5_CULNU|nr:secreted salivary protein [Culicoides nubeculosus]